MKEERNERRTVCINPPPQDRRCEVCGRHISELKPFGGTGDPLVGDFTGAFLVKKFRTLAPRFADEQLHDYKKKYGDEPADIYKQAMNTVGASWECRDCIVLSAERARYFDPTDICAYVGWSLRAAYGGLRKPVSSNIDLARAVLVNSLVTENMDLKRRISLVEDKFSHIEKTIQDLKKTVDS
jgi:hypothetical protein